MTPNPQNIGAAPEEYPIRALVLAYNPSLLHPDMLGTVRQWRQSGSDSFETRCDLSNCCGGGNTWVARGNAIAIDPTPEQIAEERAKAGLPSQEGEALPEAKPKGPSPSEVTQPGEGVDLEAIEARANAASPGPWENEKDNRVIRWDEIGPHRGEVILETKHFPASTGRDCEFIAHARQDIPALIAEVRRLRSSNEGLRSALDGLFNGGWTKEAIETARAALGKAGAA